MLKGSLKKVFPIVDDGRFNGLLKALDRCEDRRLDEEPRDTREQNSTSSERER